MVFGIVSREGVVVDSAEDWDKLEARGNGGVMVQ